MVGLSVIKQTISALENYRFEHEHLYKHIPEAQIGLRLDARIRRFESAAKHNEPKRIESAQVLKASGSSSGKEDQLSVEDGCLMGGNRYIHQGRARTLLTLVPDGLLWAEGDFCWPTRSRDAAFGHNHCLSWRKLSGCTAL